jgi:hypothetical protein
VNGTTGLRAPQVFPMYRRTCRRLTRRRRSRPSRTTRPGCEVPTDRGGTVVRAAGGLSSRRKNAQPRDNTPTSPRHADTADGPSNTSGLERSPNGASDPSLVPLGGALSCGSHGSASLPADSKPLDLPRLPFRYYAEYRKPDLLVV